MVKIGCFLMAFLLMLACPASWGEPSIVSKQKQLTQLQTAIKQTDFDVSKLQHEKNQLIQQLMRQEKHYGQIAGIIKALKQTIKHQNSALKVVSAQFADTRKKLDRQKRQLENQIKSAHAMGNKERLKVLLNQGDPALSSRMLVYYDYLNKARLKKLNEFDKNFRRLKQLQVDKHQKSEALAVILEKRKSEQAELQAVRKGREKLLVSIEKQFSSKKMQLQRLKVNAKKLQRLILSLQQNSDDFPFQEGPGKPFAQLKGRLPWPVKGRLVKNFASPRSETRWDGVLINAREGIEIHAITRGRVVYADWLRGYGLLTIIDHGEGYMTLYAFNQSLYKSEGDWVEAGDVIASVGKSGGRSHAALYFGIRKKGKPVNPALWCRKVRNGRVG